MKFFSFVKMSLIGTLNLNLALVSQIKLHSSCAIMCECVCVCTVCVNETQCQRDLRPSKVEKCYVSADFTIEMKKSALRSCAQEFTLFCNMFLPLRLKVQSHFYFFCGIL